MLQIRFWRIRLICLDPSSGYGFVNVSNYMDPDQIKTIENRKKVPTVNKDFTFNRFNLYEYLLKSDSSVIQTRWKTNNNKFIKHGEWVFLLNQILNIFLVLNHFLTGSGSVSFLAFFTDAYQVRSGSGSIDFVPFIFTDSGSGSLSNDTDPQPCCVEGSCHFPVCLCGASTSVPMWCLYLCA